MYNSQDLAYRIKTIAKSKNIPTGTMLKECGVGKNSLSSMQSTGHYPRVDKLIKIADYLDCSIDYLLGRTDIVSINKTENN